MRRPVEPWRSGADACQCHVQSLAVGVDSSRMRESGARKDSGKATGFRVLGSTNTCVSSPSADASYCGVRALLYTMPTRIVNWLQPLPLGWRIGASRRRLGCPDGYAVGDARFPELGDREPREDRLGVGDRPSKVDLARDHQADRRIGRGGLETTVRD